MSENVHKNRKLSTKQQKAIRAILEGYNQQDSATIAGVTSRTLRRWCNQDTLFAAELENSSQVLIIDAKHQLVGSISVAINMLRQIMIDENMPPTVRQRAANSTLVHAIKFLELYNLNERMSAIELTLTELE